MPTYESELEELKYSGNIVIRLAGEYYAIRNPDSGLTIPQSNRKLLRSLVLNPSQLDPKRVSTTISSYSFSLVDKNGVVSSVVKDTGASMIGQTLELWIGRSNVGMDFSSYKKLPDTKISKCNKVGPIWNFATKESVDRMNRPTYNESVRLDGDILSATTIIRAKDDISGFPSTGFFMLDDEVISYASKSDGTKTFSGCARGEFGSAPEDHEDNTTLQIAETITDNPLNIILKLLTSGSGSGSYDTLTDGLAIDPSLVDVDAIEELREELFADVSFALVLSNIENTLRFIEDELLEPCNLRFTYGSNATLTLVKLDKARFVEDLNTLDHDTIVGEPQLTVDDTKIVNRIEISYDYDYGTRKYSQKRVFTDDDSIATYGKSSSPLTFEWKGVSDDDFVTAFAESLLDRLSTPKPEVELRAFISKSTLNIGDKARVETATLPNERGELNFASDMETVYRAINHQTGEVKLKLVYTSYTQTRLGYISPSDQIAAVVSQKRITLGAGRTDLYKAGWKMRLFSLVGNELTADAVNEIEEIDGDDLIFVDNFSTTLTTNHLILFADYDQVAESQKRYAFANPNSEDDFSASEKSYKIVS